MSAVKAQRDKNVRETIGRIRTLEQQHGVNPESLESIKTVLLDLAAQTELFPVSEFYPEKDAHGMYPIYRLSEDEDHRFAMYMSTSIGAKDVPPHDHTTWAVIVGVQGTEENRFYERIDDGSVPGKGSLKQVGGETVRPGVGVCLMPDDIHSIHPRNAEPALHIHMYGLALDHLPNRVTFDMEAGTYKVFPANPNIRDV
ncbi:MAG: cysteine dioxygenase family protein [Candidatus Tectomicrobia bacterium]|nr:cysteine dioxygenase family protein [Candidatus Tectomicrobia bacterium]